MRIHVCMQAAQELDDVVNGEERDDTSGTSGFHLSVWM